MALQKNSSRTRTKLKFTVFKLVTVTLVLLCADALRAQTAVEYVEGEVIVTFKKTQADSAARGILRTHSLSWTRHYDYLSGVRGRHMGLIRDKRRSTAALFAELSQEPGIESVETNYIRRAFAALPNDSYFQLLWGLHNTGQAANGASGTAGDDIHFSAAWALSQVSTTNPVVSAVIDTGLDVNHTDIIPNLWINAGEIAGNGLDDDANGYVDDLNGYDFVGGTGVMTDAGYHGSHVSGTIAATGNNQQGVIGVNYLAKIMALKTSSDGSTISDSAEIEALQYAAMMKGRGVNIVSINASFGGGGSNSVEMAAIAAAGDAGIVFCAAAGNSSLNHDTTTTYPASYRLPNMIVVAASDQNDALASFSDYGATTVDIAAPGVNVLSISPTNLSVTSAALTNYVKVGSNVFTGSPLTYAGSTAGVTGSIYSCGLGYPADFPAAVSNNIAFIQRGTLTFAVKTSNAMSAGAKAVIIYNTNSGSISFTLGSAANWVPVIALSQTDGAALKALLPTSGTLVNTYLDGPYRYLNGTSMATPHLTGAVAFAAMNFPTETVTQRIARVLTNADTIPSLTGLVKNASRLNLQRIVDSDGNGLPDWWEQKYFGHLTGTDPSADPDHDGMSNLAEFLAGTDPTDAASNLRLAVPGLNSTNGVLVQWSSVAGRTYRLLKSTNLLAGFNSIIATNIASTPPTNYFYDPSIISSGQVYYRLMLEQ